MGRRIEGISCPRCDARDSLEMVAHSWAYCTVCSATMLIEEGHITRLVHNGREVPLDKFGHALKRGA